MKQTIRTVKGMGLAGATMIALAVATTSQTANALEYYNGGQLYEFAGGGNRISSAGSIGQMGSMDFDGKRFSDFSYTPFGTFAADPGNLSVLFATEGTTSYIGFGLLDGDEELLPWGGEAGAWLQINFKVSVMDAGSSYPGIYGIDAGFIPPVEGAGNFWLQEIAFGPDDDELGTLAIGGNTTEQSIDFDRGYQEIWVTKTVGFGENGGSSLVFYQSFHDHSVPDGGLTLSLLGFGLMGIEGLRRRLSK